MRTFDFDDSARIVSRQNKFSRILLWETFETAKLQVLVNAIQMDVLLHNSIQFGQNFKLEITLN